MAISEGVQALDRVQTQSEKNAEALRQRLLLYADFHNRSVDETVSTTHDTYSYIISIEDYRQGKPEDEQVTGSQLELILNGVFAKLEQNKCVTCDLIITRLRERYTT